MATLTIDFPGIEVIDQSQVVARNFPFGTCYMIGSASKGTEKALFKVTDLSAFTLEFGASNSTSYVEAFFKNLNGNADLYFYRVNTGSAGTLVPAVHADYLAAIDALDPTRDPGGILIAPEYYETATFTEANRLALSNKIDIFCTTDNGSYWIAFLDLPKTLTTVADMVTNRNNSIISAKGNLYVYGLGYKNNNDVSLVPSAAMAAIALSLWQAGQYYLTPAGTDIQIKDVKSLLLRFSKTDLTTLHANGINALIYFSNINAFVPYDSISVSKVVEFFQLNSVVCFKVVAFLVYDAVLPFIHSSLKGTADNIVLIDGTLNRVLYDAWNSGYLTGRNTREAFDVSSENLTLPQPNAARIVFKCEVRPAYSIQKITIYLTNTQQAGELAAA